MSEGHTGFMGTLNGEVAASLLRLFPYLCGD